MDTSNGRSPSLGSLGWLALITVSAAWLGIWLFPHLFPGDEDRQLPGDLILVALATLVAWAIDLLAPSDRPRGSFSLRALLLVTTLVAMGLGLVVYAIKNGFPSAY
jgi:hypothetical protein